jgi:hypothetical protein
MIYTGILRVDWRLQGMFSVLIVGLEENICDGGDKGTPAKAAERGVLKL